MWAIIVKCHKLGSLTTKIYLSQLYRWEVQDQDAGRLCLEHPGSQMVDRVTESPRASSIKVPIPFTRTQPSDPVTSESLHLLVPPAWRLGFQ
jgi:hypothetical protein